MTNEFNYVTNESYNHIEGDDEESNQLTLENSVFTRN
jgi:hypothetical protein